MNDGMYHHLTQKVVSHTFCRSYNGVPKKWSKTGFVTTVFTGFKNCETKWHKRIAEFSV